MPCGGEIGVWIQADPHQGFLRLAREDPRGALVTDLESGARWLLEPSAVPEGLSSAIVAAAQRLMWTERAELVSDEEREMFIDVTFPTSRILIVGAIDFAAQLCKVARAVGWLPFVIDPRVFFAQPERFPHAEEVIAAWPHGDFARLGIDPSTAIAVLTHDPKLDDAALRHALASPAAYIGAMGSRQAQAERRKRLLSRGVSEEALRRVAAPIGLDLGAPSAEETALAIMSEIVAVRHGRAAGPAARGGGPDPR